MNTNVKHLIKGLVHPKLKLHLFATHHYVDGGFDDIL